MRRILIVKTSSMGDVIHTFPALDDLLRAEPRVEVDWLVEAPFAPLVALHEGVAEVIPQSFRRWRRQLHRPRTWAEMGAVRRRLRERVYDAVIDFQGLLKSAMWVAQTLGPRVGFDRASAREPLAALAYDTRVTVPRELHAVERSRRLMAAALGRSASSLGPATFSLACPPLETWAPSRGGSFAVLMPCASREEKRWSRDGWLTVGRQLRDAGHELVLMWGAPHERQQVDEIAGRLGAQVPPFLTVREAAAVIARADLAVGLDTGFSHLAAAFGLPTVGIYCDHEPGLAGLTGPGFVRSLGGKGRRPEVAEVSDAVRLALEVARVAQVAKG